MAQPVGQLRGFGQWVEHFEGIVAVLADFAGLAAAVMLRRGSTSWT
ncbi:MAG TPA: hypothetical protein VGA66_11140 [Mycobacterium sp.]|jgi:hypothetical protein